MNDTKNIIGSRGIRYCFSSLDSEKETIFWDIFKSTHNMSEEDANKLVQLKETDFCIILCFFSKKYRKAKRMIAIIDYDAGNLKSVEKAFYFFGTGNISNKRFQ